MPLPEKGLPIFTEESLECVSFYENDNWQKNSFPRGAFFPYIHRQLNEILYISIKLISFFLFFAERADLGVREEPAGVGGHATGHRSPGGLRLQEKEQRNTT